MSVFFPCKGKMNLHKGSIKSRADNWKLSAVLGLVEGIIFIQWFFKTMLNLIALLKPSWKHGFSTLVPWNCKIPIAIWPTLLHHKDKSFSCPIIISNSCSHTPLFPRFSNFHDLDWFLMNFTSGILQSHFHLLYLIEFPFNPMITPFLTP